ncbi:MAG: NADH-quinone oxidoreductase subunit NuoH [Novosphingobium sp.]
MTSFFQTLGMSYEWAWGLATICGILLIALPLMLGVAMIIYADRKIWAAMALRRGPNVVGPFGLLQSFADGLKVFLQETIIPSAANKGLFLIAPIITFTVALMAWAVIPFNSGAILANINVGLLYVLAVSSLGVYGTVIAGWSSNSKYPFFSAMRASAQMISYEVSIGFILICVVLWAGSFNMKDIVEAQRAHVWLINGFVANPLLFPMWVMFLISGMAETGRAPFDLTEAESELVAGYQTEYSSMSFALYWLGEYANVLLMCALNATLFWGGYLPPLDIDLFPWFHHPEVPGFVWLLVKILGFFFIFSWVKATVPRYRYDQLMRLGWKVFLPVSLGFVVVVSGYLMLTRYRCTEEQTIIIHGDGDIQGTFYECPDGLPKNILEKDMFDLPSFQK